MSDPDDIRITRGIPAGQEHAVAVLYWEAFGAKLAPALSSRERGVAYLRAHLVPERILCATEHGRVLGVLGFDEGGLGAVHPTYRGLVRAFSPFSAPWRALMLAVLARSARPEEFQLDGISVSAAARGRGIGSRLLDEAKREARERGKVAVRLSVIDTNPRARALYERSGFVPAGTVTMGPLAPVFGFRTASDMVYRMSSEERE
ncbi:GNAT family N-acetyltransferase [Leucobacter sp. M11]|uniref:GNAT family N-acetyltransferase n=1 Tax=Leucobacter sp. M11 TaxID=2993565 RepID=UPI002D80996B|nr:GNAT family N-acetyltransferase [Leucobacter sp. M11]MEB4613659.1 GNAT family N-acetyltransferase [Leucobacter sp. M11]